MNKPKGAASAQVREGEAQDDSMRLVRGQAHAWESVVAVLDKVVPDWNHADGTCAMDRACKVIATLAKPAPEPVPDCTAADDTPSKSRAKRIRLENGESVAVALNTATEAMDADGEFIHKDDHARIVAELQYNLTCAKAFGDQSLEDIDRLFKENEALEASLAACRALLGICAAAIDAACPTPGPETRALRKRIDAARSQP